MRKLILIRKNGSLDEVNETVVICNAKTIGNLKKDENEKTFVLPKGESAIQVQINVGDKVYRSNAIFALRNKDVKLVLTQSGSKLHLEPQN